MKKTLQSLAVFVLASSLNCPAYIFKLSYYEQSFKYACAYITRLVAFAWMTTISASSTFDNNINSAS